MTFGGTLNLSFAAQSSYTDPTAFHTFFTWFLVVMGLLMAIFFICALRTNIILCTTLTLFVPAFGCLAGAYFATENGKPEMGIRFTKAGGALAFLGSLLVGYLWVGMLFDAVDFPVTLPIGNLSMRFLGREERRKVRERETREKNQVCHRAIGVTASPV
jgi:hypothetical protein